MDLALNNLQRLECHKTKPICRGVSTHLPISPGCNTKQSDGEVPVMLELWEMRSTPSLPLLPSPLWPGMVAPDRVQFIG